jgi:hypothetical protein
MGELQHFILHLSDSDSEPESPRGELHGYGGGSVHPMAHNSSQPRIVEEIIRCNSLAVFDLKAID